jgi:hypothetical protein
MQLLQFEITNIQNLIKVTTLNTPAPKCFGLNWPIITEHTIVKTWSGECEIRQRPTGKRVYHFKNILIIVFSGSAAQRGLWPPRPRGFMMTHNDAPQSVGLLWTSDQLVAETST